jgi:hypothetical protein
VGNGIALPCAYFVLSGIVWAADFLLKQHEAWQGPALPEEVWLAPARVHRKDVVSLKELAVFLIAAALVLLTIVTYSLCVMAKDEDDVEQVKWLRERENRNEKTDDAKGK